MNNACVFSPCRRYRYTLQHVWNELVPVPRLVMWIGLNPSTADEQHLDPTLRRIRSFSMAWGFDGFCMTNLFAFRATDPKDMKREADPIGTMNDAILEARAMVHGIVVACWGTHGKHLERGDKVTAMLQAYAPRVHLRCLARNSDGSPKHPLYVKADTALIDFQ